MQVIGTAGHVDHGKSTLVERLTGIDPDRWAEEKRRGLTLDLGFAWLPLPSGNEIGLIDVPGHERFIKNMLAGAGGITVCLFVVAANEGWMPQSAEHLAILDVLGIEHGVVAVTKADTVDEATLNLAIEEARERIAITSLKGAAVVACSGTTGAGLEELVAAIDTAVAAAPTPPDVGRPRLWIDRVFTIAGAGTVVTGSLAHGTLRVGDVVDIAPEGRRARVRGIQSHKRSLESVGPGNRVALNLAGVDKRALQRGDAIVKPSSWHPTRIVDARVRVLSSEITGIDHKLTAKGAHLLYAGSAETPVRLQLLDKDEVRAGDSAWAELHLRNPLPLERGDRFVLRDAGRVLTFGGGEIVDPLARPARGAKTERARVLADLERASGAGAVTVLVESEESADLSEVLFRARASDPGDEAVVLGDRVISPRRLEELTAALRDHLAQHHQSHPLEAGMPKETLRAAMKLSNDAFDQLVARVGDVEDRGAVAALRSFSVTLSPEQESARTELMERVAAGDFSPPLAGELGAEPALLRSLVDANELVRIGDFYLTAENAARARAQVRAAIDERGPLTVAEIRDLLGTSRKYAVPLCEWLDGTGATLRRGDVRIKGPNP